MSAALGLDALLVALREAGLPVGVAEVARLQRVFALEPGFEDERRLRSVLRAILVRTAEDRARFEPVFEAWIGRAGQEMVLREDSPPPPPPVPVKPPRRRSVWRVLALVLALASLLCLLLIWTDEVVRKSVLPTLPAATPETQTAPPPVPTGRVLTPDEIRQRTFETWVPTITVTPAEPEWMGWPAVTLGGLALLAAVALWLNLRHQIAFPERAPEPAKKGPPRVFLPPPDLSGPQLLEPREQEALVWGIGQFVSEEPTRRLNLTATVRETAKAAGLPTLLFHQARHAREVWLWIDEAAEDPALFRIAAEIEASLQSHGLPVETALFRGIPDLLVNASGDSFAPNEVDERRDAALVAILTDGRILTRQYAADDRRVRLDALLRGLSHWPRLAFVDFSAEPGDLTAILAKHSLLKIAPTGLAGFLGSDETARRKAGGAVSGDAIWAAACAVAPASVDELRAFELRKRLGLATSPWALRSLRAEAPGPPGRLQWAPPDRARRVNWLLAAEAQGEGSLLDRALSYWEEVYDRKPRDGSWLDTPADQHLAMERALLSLWRDPGTAARELFRLYGGALRDPVERELRHLAPAGWGGPDLLHFPWSWESLPAPERAMLQQMGLGGGMPPVTPRRPGRLWMGLGICLGLAVGALGAAAWSGQQTKAEMPTIIHSPTKPDGAFHVFVNASIWTQTNATEYFWVVTAATRKTYEIQNVPAGSRVLVQWKKQKRQCVVRLTDGSEVWLCGTITGPVRFSGKAGRRVFVLLNSTTKSEASSLAVDLLDSGSADQVILNPGPRLSERKHSVGLKKLAGNPQEIPAEYHWRYSDGELYSPEPHIPSTLRRLIKISDNQVQISYRLLGEEEIALPDSDWKGLRQALRFSGTRPLKQVWPDVKLLAGDPSALLRGLPACQNGETLEENGMIFVRICPGTFTMGSASNDPLADEDEKPAHEVTLSEFWIGRTEVTNAQYRADQPGHQGADDLPATEVSWHEAKAFCERRGWRLPTEAEWEHAARAGTQTPWSFADAMRSGDFAWYEGNSNREPQPVGSKLPNLWGLYDMHGNVWEWVEDWYGPYKAGPQKDPRGPATGEYRALRGGSFIGAPRLLRSAGRGWVLPSYRIRFIGFRCARSPRRQP